MAIKVMDEPLNKADYQGFRITTMYAFCAIDPSNDSEGIGGFMSKNGPMPLIATDNNRFEQLMDIAQTLANKTNTKFKIVQFSVRDDLGEIVPNGDETGG